MAKRTIKNWILRYIVFLIGLLFVSFGVAFSKQTLLGTTPISVIPNTLSVLVPALTIGNWTIVFSVLLVLAQIPILKGKVNYVEILLEIAISFGFGYVIDFAVWCISPLPISSTHYVVRLLVLVASCILVGIGAYFQVTAGVAMLPGDAFCRSIAIASSKKYSTIRVISDLSMTAIAFILCLSFPPHELTGVREGTLIAAFLVGNVVKLTGKLLDRPMQKLLSIQ